VVALRVDPGGALLEARPAPSSGAPELLVAAALEAVRAGAPYPAPPSGAGGLAVDVPVRFTLRR